MQHALPTLIVPDLCCRQVAPQPDNPEFVWRRCPIECDAPCGRCRSIPLIQRSELNFSDLGLAAPLLSALAEAGFTAPTQVQQSAIPAALAGSDLLVSSQTGSGKTAAFMLPSLQRLLTPATAAGKGPRIL